MSCSSFWAGGPGNPVRGANRIGEACVRRARGKRVVQPHLGLPTDGCIRACPWNIAFLAIPTACLPAMVAPFDCPITVAISRPIGPLACIFPHVPTASCACCSNLSFVYYILKHVTQARMVTMNVIARHASVQPLLPRPCPNPNLMRPSPPLRHCFPSSSVFSPSSSSMTSSTALRTRSS